MKILMDVMIDDPQTPHGTPPHPADSAHPRDQGVDDTSGDESPEARHGGMRSRPLKTLQTGLPLAMAVHLFSALALTVQSWQTEIRLPLALWCACVCGIAIWDWICRGRQGHAGARSTSGQASRIPDTQADLLALLWTANPLWWLPVTDSNLHLLLTVAVIGVLAVGARVLPATPAVAVLQVVTVCVGWTFAMLRWGTGDQDGFVTWFAACGFASICGIWLAGAIFKAHARDAAHVADTSVEIGHLFLAFEARSSAILWELDAECRLTRLSVRLPELPGRNADKWIGQSVLMLMEPQLADSEEARSAWSELLQRLLDRRGFCGLVMPLRHGLAIRCWSISGRPLTDQHGRFSGWRGVVADVGESAALGSPLAWPMERDELTGLANRRHFSDCLRSLLQATPEDFSPIAVAYLDIDDFRRLNDEYGWAAGDEALRILAGRLVAATRQYDLVARLGADEFGLILRDIGQVSDAESHLGQLFDVIREPVHVAGKRLVLSLSMGVTHCQHRGARLDALLAGVNVALESAKQYGGGHFRIYGTPPVAPHQRRVELECELRAVDDYRDFSLEFQPIIAIDTCSISGFEALLRWNHPSLGLVSPAEFIPIAEALGLLPGIGRWVMQRSCIYAAAWPADLVVSVNVSALQLMEPDFVDSVLTATAPLPPSRITLEITESVLIDYTDAVMARMLELKARGFRLALDDFGSGYCGLGYLRRLPFDTLKVDQGIVKDVASNQEASGIVSAIINLSKALGLCTVAEGVTTPSEANRLRELGCTAIQGFLVSHPLSPADVHRFMATWSAPAEWRPQEPAGSSVSSIGRV